jgi:hypothetical protein
MDAGAAAEDAEIEKEQRLLRLILGTGRAEGDCPTAGGYR